jgi:hypothetical protein
MQVFSTFENTMMLEMAIKTLEKNGIQREDIFAVPLDKRQENTKLFDSIHNSDGESLIDLGMVLATVFSVIGASIGFVLSWGPIIWGLLGVFLGFFLGLVIRLIYGLVKSKKMKLSTNNHSEVILIINCEEKQSKLVEDILWNHFALGVAKVMNS